MDVHHLKCTLEPFFSKYHDEIVAVYLFGSVANGTESQKSDLDIAILARNSHNCRPALKLDFYTDISRILKRNDIDIVLLDLSGNLVLHNEIIRHGKILYSVDDELREGFEVNLIHRYTDFKSQRYYAMGV